MSVHWSRYSELIWPLYPRNLPSYKGSSIWVNHRRGDGDFFAWQLYLISLAHWASLVILAKSDPFWPCRWAAETVHHFQPLREFDILSRAQRYRQHTQKGKTAGVSVCFCSLNKGFKTSRIFVKSKFHLNNYVQEEHERKKVYKQTCLALELERIPQHVSKIPSRQTNTHTRVWTHTDFFRPQLSYTFVWGLGVSENATKPNETTAKRFTYLRYCFPRVVYSLSESRCFPSPGSVGWVGGGGRKGRAKKSKGSEEE